MYFNEIKKYFENYYETIDNCKIKEIIKYSLEDGKCIRSFLVKHLMEKLSSDNNISWEPIIAIELIHGSSLIIDDLPCMDNDEIRRNKPSTFKQFGERQSILVSMYCISESFNLILKGLTNRMIDNNDFKYKFIVISKIINNWSELIGKNLIIGQMLDLKENIETLINFKISNNNQTVKNIMIFKTCSLFMFTFLLGALFSNNDKINLEEFKEMGYHFGIMFQIMDDYKDMSTDNNYANFILTNGLDKSIKEYLNSREKLLKLLNKNNIATVDILILVNLIDTKFNLNNKIIKE